MTEDKIFWIFSVTLDQFLAVLRSFWDQCRMNLFGG
jgi:hypothetical protein